jgi:hypothetical protein
MRRMVIGLTLALMVGIACFAVSPSCHAWVEGWVAGRALDRIVESFDPKTTCREYGESEFGIPVTCKLAWAGTPGEEIKVTVAAGTATAVKVIGNYAILDTEHPVGLRRNAAGKFVPMTDDSRP